MLTVIALYFWPWQWSLDPEDGDEFDEDGLRKSENEKSAEQNSEDQNSEDQKVESQKVEDQKVEDQKDEDQKVEDQKDEHQKSEDRDDIDEMAKSVPSLWDRITHSIDWHNRLRRCLFLAALACILRPTNILIWMCFACFVILRIVTHGKVLSLPWEGMQLWLNVSSLSLLPATKRERLVLAREVALCGHV